MRFLMLGLLGFSANTMAEIPEEEGQLDQAGTAEAETAQPAEAEGEGEAAPEGEGEAAPEGEEAPAEETTAEPDSEPQPEAGPRFASGGGFTRGSAYGDMTTVVKANVFHVVGEGRILPWLAASGGFGFGKLDLEQFTFKSSGGRVMMHVITGKKKGHFEVGTGYGFYKYSVTEKLSGQGFSEEIKGSGLAYFLGYRFQPPAGGVLIRVGLANLAPGLDPDEVEIPVHLIPTLDLSGGYSF